MKGADDFNPRIIRVILPHHLQTLARALAGARDLIFATSSY